MEKQKNTKEVTCIFTAEVTIVSKNQTEEQAAKIEAFGPEAMQRLAAAMKKDLGVDDVNIIGRKVFVRDEEKGGDDNG